MLKSTSAGAPPGKRSRGGSGKSVTLQDVARLAGVSPATVSRVISQPALVSPATRALVETAVAQIGYVPNLVAGSLASARSRLVAAIVPSISTLMFAKAVEAFADRLRQAGYQVLLGISDYDRAREEELVLAVLGRKPDAVLVTGVNHTPLSRRLLLGAGIPVIEAWDLTRSPIDTVIGFSHEEVGRATARFLLGKGYRNFAVALADEERARLRHHGLLAELGAHGVADVPVSLMAPPTTFSSGRAALADLLARGKCPRVIVCSSDPPAEGAVTEAQARGLRVPQDIAVMGFGDLELASGMRPSLSSVRIDPAHIGLAAAEAILGKLEGHAGGETDGERVIDVGFEIRAREST